MPIDVTLANIQIAPNQPPVALTDVIPGVVIERVQAMERTPISGLYRDKSTQWEFCPIGAILYQSDHRPTPFPQSLFYPSIKDLVDGFPAKVLSGERSLAVAGAVILEFTKRGDRPKSRQVDWMTERVPAVYVQKGFR